MSRKLAVVIAVHLVHATVLLIITAYGLRALDGSRAYVEGEGLWSKAQKDSVLHLLVFAETGNQSEFDAYLAEIDVTLGDKQARLELEKDDPDMALVRDGFTRGRLHPDDIGDMAWLFRTFRWEPHLDAAIGIWAQADSNVTVLMGIAEELRAARATPVPDVQDVARLRGEILEINVVLTGLEEDFSATLGSAARFLSTVVVVGTIGLTIVFVGGALLISAALARHLTRSLHLLRGGARRMASGEAGVTVELAGADEVAGVAHAFNDMSHRLMEAGKEREASEATIQRQRASLAQAQAAAHLGSWELDIVTGKVHWSDELYRLYGVLPQEFEATLDAALRYCHPDDRDRVAASIARAQHDRAALEVDYRVVRPDGGVRWLHATGKVWADDTGRSFLMSGTAQDVTAERAAETERREGRERRLQIEHLQEVDRFKTTFINTAAHELRTPLMPLRTHLHLLRTTATAADPDAQRLSLDVMHRNLERLSRLVEDLLQVARAQAGNLALELAPTDIRAVVAEAVGSYHQTARERRITLQLVSAPHRIIQADAKRITQVIGNLLGNALKFTGPEGTVRVVVDAEGDSVRLSVADNGIGVSVDRISSLFLPFVQVHDTSQVTESGTGLGLFICKQIVELHGGRIGIQSAGLGRGTTVWVVLPVSGPKPNRPSPTVAGNFPDAER